MTLTVEQLKLRPGFVGTTIDDSVLSSELAAAYEAIAAYAGADGNVTEWIRRPHGRLLMLARSASAIVSVTEGTTALAATDYELNDQTLRRLATGTHPARWWCGDIDVVYTPIDQDDERDRVAAELVGLSLTFRPGIASQQIGPWREAYQEGGAGQLTYEQQRATILATLGAAAGIR